MAEPASWLRLQAVVNKVITRFERRVLVKLGAVVHGDRLMKRLMQKLLAARVRPYYIYRPGGRRRAVPHYVIDAPGRGGKIPLLPHYVEAIDDDQVVLRNYAGEDFVYKQPLSDSGRSPRSSSLSW